VAEGPPFSEDERTELRQVANILFEGGHITHDYVPFVQKWGYCVRLFLVSVDHENASLVHLPCSGGVLEQPFRTMQVFEYLQSLFIKYVNKEQKKIKNRAKRG
jgi:hypothetical protein